jgi:hypothetical protein
MVGTRYAGRWRSREFGCVLTKPPGSSNSRVRFTIAASVKILARTLTEVENLIVSRAKSHRARISRFRRSVLSLRRGMPITVLDERARSIFRKQTIWRGQLPSNWWWATVLYTLATRLIGHDQTIGNYAPLGVNRFALGRVRRGDSTRSTSRNADVFGE